MKLALHACYPVWNGKVERNALRPEQFAAWVDYAREKGIRRLELNMWEFNQDALAFYEAAGFSTYRRYMEMFI